MLDIQKEMNHINKIIQKLYEIKLELKILSFKQNDTFIEKRLKNRLYELGISIKKEMR